MVCDHNADSSLETALRCIVGCMFVCGLTLIAAGILYDRFVMYMCGTDRMYINVRKLCVHRLTVQIHRDVRAMRDDAGLNPWSIDRVDEFIDIMSRETSIVVDDMVTRKHNIVNTESYYTSSSMYLGIMVVMVRIK